MKRILQFLFMLTVCYSSHSQAVFNMVETSYVTTTISQTVVLDNTMKANGGTFTFSVQAHNGGGNASTGANNDTANVKILFYDANNTLLSTAATNYSKNLPIPNGYHGVDPTVPWTTLSISSTNCGGSCANVAYAKVQMVGIDGAFWAGDYGPYYQQPVLSFNGGSNILYNPEFGTAPNGTLVQGWSASPNWGVCQGAYGGSNPCTTNYSGVTANASNGGYSATGGTTAAAPGGYTSTAPAAPTYPTYVTVGSGTPGTMTFSDTSTITSTNQSKVATWTNKVNSDGNQIYIQQVYGDGNTVTMNQDGNKNLINATLRGSNSNITARQGVASIGQNEMKINVEGNGNAINLNQARDTQGNPVGGNGHYLSVQMGAWGTNLTVQQTNSGGVGGHYNETTINGNGNNVTEKQTDNGNKIMFVKVQGDINTVDVTQKGTGQHKLDATLVGNFNNATVLQEGTVANNATISLTNAGGPATVTVQQNGGQSVGVTTSCSTSGGCAPILVRQGY